MCILVGGVGLADPEDESVLFGCVCSVDDVDDALHE